MHIVDFVILQNLLMFIFGFIYVFFSTSWTSTFLFFRISISKDLDIRYCKVLVGLHFLHSCHRTPNHASCFAFIFVISSSVLNGLMGRFLIFGMIADIRVSHERLRIRTIKKNTCQF